MNEMEAARSDTPVRLRRGYMLSVALQWVRELLVNSLQAGAKNIHFTVEWTAVLALGIYRRMVVDDGCGINEADFPKFLNHVGGSGKHTSIIDNFGIGFKSSCLFANRYGVAVLSGYTDPIRGFVSNMVWLHWTEDDGSTTLDLSHGDEHRPGRVGMRDIVSDFYDQNGYDTKELVDVRAAFVANGGDARYALSVLPLSEYSEVIIDGVDWAKAMPESIVKAGHGTAVIMMGNHPMQHTFLGDPSRNEANKYALSEYLNTKFEALPSDVEVRMMEFDDHNGHYAKGTSPEKGTERLQQAYRDSADGSAFKVPSSWPKLPVTKLGREVRGLTADIDTLYNSKWSDGTDRAWLHETVSVPKDTLKGVPMDFEAEIWIVSKPPAGSSHRGGYWGGTDRLSVPFFGLAHKTHDYSELYNVTMGTSSQAERLNRRIINNTEMAGRMVTVLRVKNGGTDILIPSEDRSEMKVEGPKGGESIDLFPIAEVIAENLPQAWVDIILKMLADEAKSASTMSYDQFEELGKEYCSDLAFPGGAGSKGKSPKKGGGKPSPRITPTGRSPLQTLTWDKFLKVKKIVGDQGDSLIHCQARPTDTIPWNGTEDELVIFEKGNSKIPPSATFNKSHDFITVVIDRYCRKYAVEISRTPGLDAQIAEAVVTAAETLLSLGVTAMANFSREMLDRWTKDTKDTEALRISTAVVEKDALIAMLAGIRGLEQEASGPIGALIGTARRMKKVV